MGTSRVAIVGAGMAGAACARELLARDVPVTIFDRSHVAGGRMASPLVHDRRADIGAGYFTVSDDAFAAMADSWRERGLAREWTDTFDVIDATGRSTTSGPVRWATAGGLRSLVRDVLPLDDPRLTQQPRQRIDSLDDLDTTFDAVVLAMPDPQAKRLAPEAEQWLDYEPVISLTVGWHAQLWSDFDAAFVNDDPDVGFVADDGARRGDGAAVLVAHSTSDRAWQHLDAPSECERPVLRALQRALDIGVDPDWTHAHRWTFAKPVGTHGERSFGLTEYRGRTLGSCTDSWCPSDSPRVESAWLSGRALGRALADRLG